VEAHSVITFVTHPMTPAVQGLTCQDQHRITTAPLCCFISQQHHFISISCLLQHC